MCFKYLIERKDRINPWRCHAPPIQVLSSAKGKKDLVARFRKKMNRA